jgi:hypothetical protein
MKLLYRLVRGLAVSIYNYRRVDILVDQLLGFL